MSPEANGERLLAPYRVLDLTGVTGHLCGKMLAEMGCDVVKVEPPGGDPARDLAPFAGDVPDRDRGLPWLFANAGKRGVTLNIEAEAGRGLLRRMVERADFVVESFKPGYLDGLALGYASLREIKSDIILTSITPFGQTGPYSQHAASDLTLMALGGFLAENIPNVGQPIRMSLDQACYHGGAYGAAASLTAHYRRLVSGQGRHVDVSIHECITNMFDPVMQDHLLGTNMGATWNGTARSRARGQARGIWDCKDGFVHYRFGVGPTARRTNVVFKWAKEAGVETGGLEDVHFEEFQGTDVTDEQIHLWHGVVAEHFARHTKEELVQGAFERRMMVYAVNNMPDLLANPHLSDRGYFVEVEHEDLGHSLTYPGPWWKSEGPSWRGHGRAPRAGEHNEEVYLGELGLEAAVLARLQAEGVV